MGGAVSGGASAESIDPARIEVVFLDAGGVLLYPDWERVSRILARYGITATSAQLAEAEFPAKRRMDDAGFATTTGDITEPDGYLGWVVKATGIAFDDPALHRAAEEFESTHASDNLWSDMPEEVPGALERLKGAGYRLAVLSNTESNLRDRIAAAGIDASNVERSRLVLLPADPDASARSLRAALRQRYGLDVAVIITDTMGRPWRLGLVDTAIGAAGIEALADYRGALDAYGNELHLTQMAVIDELAGAAELVKGKCDQVPVAVVRGLPRLSDVDGSGAVALVRDAEQDMFSLGTAEARALGRHDAATLADATGFAERMVDPEVVGRALAAVGAAFVRVTDAGVRDKLCAALPTMPAGPAEVVVPGLDNRSGGDPDRWAGAQVGATVHRLRAELAAAGLATAWLRADPDTVADIVALPDGYAPLGVLAVGIAGG